jgi:hypothetical protein
MELERPYQPLIAEIQHELSERSMNDRLGHSPQGLAAQGALATFPE